MASHRTYLLLSSVGAAVSTTAFCLQILPHTFFLNKYKKIVQKYKFAEEEPLNDYVESLFQEVLSDLKIDGTLSLKYHPFAVTGFNEFHAGLASNVFKSIIGIPTHYQYKDKLDIDATQIRIGNDQEPLDMYHPATQNLLESLILSEDAKKFGIAREIVMSENQIPMYSGFWTLSIFTGSPFALDYIARKYNIYSKSRTVHMLFYGISSVVILTVWLQIKDILYTYFEKQVDKEIAQLGPNYVKGGKEFYDKLLKRHIALRTLLGEQGAKIIKGDGDEIFFIRQKRTPITHRKKFFDEFQVAQQSGEQQNFL